MAENTLYDEPLREGHDANDNRPFQTPDGILVHATTVDNLDKILKEGLKPRSESFCQVWSKEEIAHRFKTDKEAQQRVLNCRENHVYFWDDYYEGVGQALVTVGFLKDKNPALLIVEVPEMDTKQDPEIEANPEEEPVALMFEGNIPPEKIKKVCVLKDELLPSVGNLMCPMKHEKKECPLKDNFDELYEIFTDLSNWVCTPAKDFKRG